MLGFGLGPFGTEGFGGSEPASSSSFLFITNFAPALTSSIARTGNIAFEVVSPGALLLVSVSALLAGNAETWETIYDGATLAPGYAGSAAASAHALAFNLTRTLKWPVGTLTLRVCAADDVGASITQTISWNVVADSVGSAPEPVVNDVALNPYGYGLTIPLQRTLEQDFDAVGGTDIVAAAVRQLLGTSVGELPWRPSYGTTLFKLRHMRRSDALAERARVAIQDAFEKWEPRVNLVDVEVEPLTMAEKSTLKIRVIYKEKNADNRFGKVVQFTL